MRVRFSPHFFEEVIQFEVELNSVPFSSDGYGKDIIVNWRMYDGFDPKGKFWTDSNSLAMMERNVNKRTEFEFKEKYTNISSNYYPVDSAIAMRNQNGSSDIQVTIMNDRAQGGSADISKKASIELMQQRRLSDDDNKGVDEPLNETDKSGNGVIVTA